MWRPVLVMAVVGWAAAGTPIRGDHALFALYGRAMGDGAVLYRDLWEVTNPGVLWFYQLAGTLFGFDEDGLHLFEWLYWLAFVLSVSAAVKSAHGLTRWPLAPAVLVGGVFYLSSSAETAHLTKAEGLVAFPLFLAAWLAVRAEDTRFRPAAHGLWLLAGACGGVAVLFKFAFAACLLAAWMPSVRRLVKEFDLQSLISLAGGFSFVLGGAMAYFIANDAVPQLRDCLFVTPREVLAHAELAGFDKLAMSVRWFVEVYSPVLAVAIAGTFVTLNRQTDRLVVSVGLMAAAAVPVILVQRWSWWTSHFLLLAIPVSVLAAYTWPVLWAAVSARLTTTPGRREKWAATAVGLALFLPVLGQGGYVYLRLLNHGFGLTAVDRAAARMSFGRAYLEAKREADWLATRPPGPAFVAGDPLISWMANRPQPGRFHGWSLELFPPRLWDELLAEWKAAPPPLIFLDTHAHRYEAILTAKAPAARAWLLANYHETRRSATGVWYQLDKHK